MRGWRLQAENVERLLTQIKDTPTDKSRFAGAVPANDAASSKHIYAIEEIAARSGGQRLLSMMSGAT
ncbi:MULTISPECIES: hypothetical protein [Bradyrhizobium]|jgi:hypothetical protein|uniref:Uncharacterized protein n=1 Tax=Bradyrhizobium elkanii TaxID=29448 RepID=A0A8I1Y8N2_BRAEL|nr:MULTISPECIES: hypothetical protein [Bradyrhizobium]MBP1293861.1 hypothetical protein [Bradyrhizobium elkanii]MCP1925555.1 hypothetical protein [Bradyrhizobium elkanii]MCS3476953.1 hypothetical protein [Bradyrhizobium elkanii]MCS3583691.1 hypothetical protein [Bradyrhizobium elkanii]MCS3717261.1 hypothetical protein [Bradyrhizobium elkanii]